jgi:MSHA biogenesis protein MshP
MSPELSLRRTRGFAAILVIALLVMLAVLGTALMTISNTQQGGHALDIQGTKAYHASRAGLEWGMFNVLRTGGAGCGAVNGASFTFADNLGGFRVTLACSASTHEEAESVTMFTLTATACNAAACPTAASPPAAYYVERQLRVTVGSN